MTAPSTENPPVRRRILLLAGPSGSGKGRVGFQSALPVINLDDFYHDHDHPGLPRAHGIVDWDHPSSWDGAEALEALRRLCHGDTASIPTYSIPTSSRTGERIMSVEGAPLIIAEGIFAAELVQPLRAHGLLADAVVLDRPAPLVFTLRFVRDVRQGRKALHTLVHRGLALARSQRSDVEAWSRAGMRRLTLTAAVDRVRVLAQISAADARSASVGGPLPHERPASITVSAVCLTRREPASDAHPGGRHLILGVRKRGTLLYMQPGGKPEAGEDARTCAVREVEEELGLRLDPGALKMLGEFTTPAANEPDTTLYSTVFVAPELSDSDLPLTPLAEIDDLQWFEIATPADDDRPLAPLFRDVVLPELRRRVEAAAGDSGAGSENSAAGSGDAVEDE